jgi:hypothetical protein
MRSLWWKSNLDRDESEGCPICWRSSSKKSGQPELTHVTTDAMLARL